MGPLVAAFVYPYVTGLDWGTFIIALVFGLILYRLYRSATDGSD